MFSKGKSKRPEFNKVAVITKTQLGAYYGVHRNSITPIIKDLNLHNYNDVIQAIERLSVRYTRQNAKQEPTES